MLEALLKIWPRLCLRKWVWWHAFALLLLLAACSARPRQFWGKVSAVGWKGLNHVVTHKSVDLPLSNLHERCRLAKRAKAPLCRGPGFVPHQLANPRIRARLLEIMRILKHYDLTVMAIVGPDPETTLEQWREHCRVVARDFPATYYEIMNEPDNLPGWPPERYALWLAVASDAIRSVRPSALICAPALGGGKHHTKKAYFDALRPVRSKWQYATVHVYGAGWPYLREVMELTDAPIIITEDGARGSENVGACMRGAFAEYLAHPRIVGIVWYALNAPPPDGQDYNLVEEDLRPGRTFKAFAEIEVQPQRRP